MMYTSYVYCKFSEEQENSGCTPPGNEYNSQIKKYTGKRHKN